ncbi:MAG: hypothetical protein BGO52_11280 [Sphingobacteriales bacterium 44-61]|nr:MAG: hypothetical protein BGO52_11280 [Sphingobacteriales bacterium 44-61]
MVLAYTVWNKRVHEFPDIMNLKKRNLMHGMFVYISSTKNLKASHKKTTTIHSIFIYVTHDFGYPYAAEWLPTVPAYYFNPKP